MLVIACAPLQSRCRGFELVDGFQREFWGPDDCPVLPRLESARCFRLPLVMAGAVNTLQVPSEADGGQGAASGASVPGVQWDVVWRLHLQRWPCRGGGKKPQNVNFLNLRVAFFYLFGDKEFFFSFLF